MLRPAGTRRRRDRNREHFDGREGALSVNAPRSKCLPHYLSPPRVHQSQTIQSHRVECDLLENDIDRDGPRGRPARGRLLYRDRSK